MNRRLTTLSVLVAPFLLACGDNGTATFAGGGGAGGGGTSTQSTATMGPSGSAHTTSTGTHPHTSSGTSSMSMGTGTGGSSANGGMGPGTGGGAVGGGSGQGGSGQGGSGQGGGSVTGTGGGVTSGGGQMGTGGSTSTGPMGCSPDGSACVVAADGKAGLCDGGTSTCIDCVDPTDDAACSAAGAYGAGHLCIAGACVSGNCRKDADCGVISAKDLCIGNQCVVCDPVANAIYIVDPVNGDDTTATGSGTVGGNSNAACAFKTVTAALAAIKVAGTANATQIQIHGMSTVGPGETFPLAIPGNTLVTVIGGPVTVSVPAGQTGFTMTAPKSGIDGAALGLTIDGGAIGAGNTPQHGLVAQAGSDATDFVTNVTFKSFANEAIACGGSAAAAAGLTMKAGVTVTTSGKPQPNKGPNVQSNFAVRAGDGPCNFVIDVPAAGAPTVIDRNVDGGLQVQGLAQLTINGVPGAQVGTGTVVVENNPGPGIEIANLAGAAAKLAAINGVVSYQNGSPSALPAQTSSGIRIVAGSQVKIRNSVSLGNGLNGIHVFVTPVVGGMPSIAGIDLGQPGSPGQNVVQNSAAQGHVNLDGVGICLEGTGVAVLKLAAEGNIFSGPVNCAGALGTPLKTNATKSCANAGDAGWVGMGSSIDVAGCTTP